MVKTATLWKEYGDRLIALKWLAIENCNETAFHEAQDAITNMLLIRQLFRVSWHSPTRRTSNLAKEIGLTRTGVYTRLKLLGLTIDDIRRACTPTQYSTMVDFRTSLDHLIKKSRVTAMLHNTQRILTEANPATAKRRPHKCHPRPPS